MHAEENKYHTFLQGPAFDGVCKSVPACFIKNKHHLHERISHKYVLLSFFIEGGLPPQISRSSGYLTHRSLLA